MKRRELKRAWEDARLSPLVGACARWLAFAHGLSQSRSRRVAASDPLSFIESLYGVRFTTVEGNGFPFDRVYRTTGGGLSISETRLSVSVHPRFDLTLLNVHPISQMFGGATKTPAHTHGERGREQQHVARIGTSAGPVNSPLTTQTWNASPAESGRRPRDFSFMYVRGRQTQWPESARPAARVERVVNGVAATSAGTTPWPAVASAPTTLRPTARDLGRPFINEPRQEFVNVILNTYLPAAVSREVLSMMTTVGLPATHTKRARARGETTNGFTHAHGTQAQRPPGWAYVEPAPRRAAGAVSRRGELRPSEIVREQAREPAPSMLQVLPPAALLLNPRHLQTGLASLDGVAESTASRSLGHALSLQNLRTYAAPSGAREASADVHAPRLFERHERPLPSVTREVLTSLHTFVERVHMSVAGIAPGGHQSIFARPDFETAPRARVELVSARFGGPSSDETRGHFGRTVAFARPAPVNAFTRELSPRGAGAQSPRVDAPGFVSTHGTPGAETFLFVKGLMLRATENSAAVPLSQPSPTARRGEAVSETWREARGRRAARPEGMALELIRQRREEVLQLPRPGYVFTQAARTQLEERQVITKASREEIVEVVRKEVHALNANSRAVQAPTRADLAAVADEVYTTLARRLMVEKERLGRF